MKASEKEESGGRGLERYYKRKEREEAAPVECQPQRETHQIEESKERRTPALL